MTDQSNFLDAWLTRARSQIAAATLAPVTEEIGRLESLGDGVAFVSGLPNVRLDEMLEFKNGVMGFAQTLDKNVIGCVLLDEPGSLEAGDIVRGTGAVVRVPVGEGLLGRIVDPLGRPLDDGGTIVAASHEPIERAAPEIVDRDAVVEPVQTGTLVVDTLFALGRGQRELVIGDRATGKTSLVVDCIINQKRSDVICVYAAIGQKSSAVKRAIDSIRRFGAPERCIFVVAQASSAPGLQWIAPFSAFAMAEYFRDRGQDALVVIDDLTKHAATHRELALLTRQPPGREAYPGDIFYVHARLLERATRLSKQKGGGSLTALPVAETDAGNLSAYIPTNLISITDGQIVLDTKLFQEGQKPAVDVGKSVSRVGGRAQAQALRDAAQDLRLDYAQFLELEVFTRFGGLTDTRVRKQIEHGKRIRAALNQPQYAPLDLASEIALIVAVQNGVLDGVTVESIAGFRAGLAGWLAAHAETIARQINETGKLGDADRTTLLDSLKTFAATFAADPRSEVMTERLADISSRIDNVRQLDSVVTAIRGIAASRAQQSRNLLAEIEAYADAISIAIGAALNFLPASPTRAADPPGDSHALILFCAEQGFAGGLSDRMLEAAGPVAPETQLIIIGSRGGAIAGERGFAVAQTIAMASQINGVPAIANLIADTLYARIVAGEITRAEILYPRFDGGHDLAIERSALFPIALEKFRRPASALPPLTTLDPQTLIERLAAEYIYAKLCDAAMHAFAAENQARMETMSAAGTNIGRTLDELKQRENQVRQEQVTAEIVELAACGG